MPMFQRSSDGEMSGDVSTPSPGETTVGKSVRLEGDFSSDENVHIDGQVSGTLKTSKDLVVGEGASLEADVFAENATISGEISGNLDIKNKLELTETARITGDIKAGVLSVAGGAMFTGQCSMSSGEEPVDAIKKTEEE